MRGVWGEVDNLWTKEGNYLQVAKIVTKLCLLIRLEKLLIKVKRKKSGQVAI
jgi:hypothetical protein